MGEPFLSPTVCLDEAAGTRLCAAGSAHLHYHAGVNSTDSDSDRLKRATRYHGILPFFVAICHLQNVHTMGVRFNTQFTHLIATACFSTVSFVHNSTFPDIRGLAAANPHVDAGLALHSIRPRPCSAYIFSCPFGLMVGACGY